MIRRPLAWLSILSLTACTSMPTATPSSRPQSATPETTQPTSPIPEPTPIGSDVAGVYEIVLRRPDDQGGPTFPLPVTVVDHIGLVVRIEAFPPAEEQPIPGHDDIHGIVSDASPH